MKLVRPKAFTMKAGKRAVLLLHGFTGNPADVRRLGRHLHKAGYTCHAPIYRGHGMQAETLIDTNPNDWWQDVLQGYAWLQEEGYEEIACAGVSLGGLFTLRAGAELDVKGLVSMSAPILEKSMDSLRRRVTSYANEYNRVTGLAQEEAEAAEQQLNQHPMPFLEPLQQMITGVREELGDIAAPLYVIQGERDERLYLESAPIIEREAGSAQKKLSFYKDSGHLITVGREKEALFQDIEAFLDTLDWKEPLE
ncbi:alpha/beta hydrolase [Alkalicoccus luteus]|uniref:alpha/beta hydrolase n=1 Tax=Alkalicoccus luteus TaxID=1237094 RepID=UPI004033CAAC